MSKPKYEPEFKKQIVKLYLGGRTGESLSTEYGVSRASITDWASEFREECLKEAENDDGKSKELLEEIEKRRQLEKELAEKTKENEFLKKVAAFFAKEID